MFTIYKQKSAAFCLCVTLEAMFEGTFFSLFRENPGYPVSRVGAKRTPPENHQESDLKASES